MLAVEIDPPAALANLQELERQGALGQWGFYEAIDYTPASRWSFGIAGRYVAKSYLDNTNSSAFTTPSFFTADATASYTFTGLTNGMSYRFVVREQNGNGLGVPSGLSATRVGGCSSTGCSIATDRPSASFAKTST